MGDKWGLLCLYIYIYIYMIVDSIGEDPDSPTNTWIFSTGSNPLWTVRTIISFVVVLQSQEGGGTHLTFPTPIGDRRKAIGDRR